MRIKISELVAAGKRVTVKPWGWWSSQRHLPYVAVSAHARHIQESMVLCHAKRLAVWDRAKLAAAST